MDTVLLTQLLQDVLEDLHSMRVLWELGLIVGCLLAGWLLTRICVRLFGMRQAVDMEHGRPFSHVLMPTVMVLLLTMTRSIFAHWQHTNLMNIAVPLIGSLAFIRFGFYVLRRSFLFGGSIAPYLGLIEKIFASLVWFALLLHFTGATEETVLLLDEIVLPIGHHKISLLSILQATASIMVTLVIALWASAALETRLMRLPNMHTSLKVVLSRTGRATLILIAVLVSLTVVGIDLTVLSVFGGALGVGLGFGLQKIASSYVSGFIILLDRSLSIGDMIAVDKFNGKVTQINTRYTVLQGTDGSESVIPNEMLVSNVVQNYSLSDKSVLLTTDFTVSYATDVETLLLELVACASQVPRVLSDPAPVALLMKFGADGLDLRLGFWIADPENGRGSVLSAVNRSVWALIQDKQIVLPSAQRTVTLVAAQEQCVPRA